MKERDEWNSKKEKYSVSGIFAEKGTIEMKVPTALIQGDSFIVVFAFLDATLFLLVASLFLLSINN